jgi:hypothetical protein
MSKEELNLARIILATRGEVHQLLTGNINGQEIRLDGKAVYNAQISNCNIYITTGNFALIGQNVFRDCHFKLDGPAANVKQLLESFQKGPIR